MGLLTELELISGFGAGTKGLAFLIGIIHKWNNALAQWGTNYYKFNSSHSQTLPQLPPCLLSDNEN